MTGYNAPSQTEKNLAWMLPRPKPDHYKGGMPLYCEDWLLNLAEDILGKKPYVLNLFCGMNKTGIRIDLNPKVYPNYIYDAHKLSELYPNPTFDIILADPPYSDEETKQLYGNFFPKLNYKKWTAECDKCLKPGGILIVYHKFLPANPNPEKYIVVKRVAIFNRIWHLPRVAVFFQKKIDLDLVALKALAEEPCTAPCYGLEPCEDCPVKEQVPL